jgi:outer membrane lipoprotein-sorting protein
LKRRFVLAAALMIAAACPGAIASARAAAASTGTGSATSAAPGAASTLESTRALTAGLKRTGRAEVTLGWDVAGVTGGPPQRVRGALAVEPPDRARLDVAGTGERITLREDGGEWLQPSVHQLVILKPRHSVGAMRWWRLLAGGTGATERKLGTGRYRLLVAATPTSDADSADVSLGAGGLPERLELDDGAGGHQVYRLSGWKFTSARGAAAFRISAPPGTETVELP